MNRLQNFYKSPEWFRARAAAIRKANGKCASCGCNIIGKGKARVDHIRPLRQYPALALDPNNLRVLCPTCDNMRHAEKGRGGVEVEEIGEDGFPSSWRF